MMKEGATNPPIEHKIVSLDCVDMPSIAELIRYEAGY